MSTVAFHTLLLWFYDIISFIDIMESDESNGKQKDKDLKRESESLNISSYGIEINREKIKCIPINEQIEAFKDLGVSAYEQEEFEDGVLQQVDDAIEEQERRIAIKAAEKSVQNIRDEIKYISNSTSYIYEM